MIYDKPAAINQPSPQEEDYSSVGGDMHRDESDAERTQRLLREWEHVQDLWAADATDDLAFYQGHHWLPEQVNELQERNQVPVVVPLTWQIVDQAISMLGANNPQFRATGRTDDDTKKAHLRSEIAQWIWQESMKCGLDFKAFLRDYYVMGRGALYVYIDPDGDLGKGEVRMMTIDPRDVIPDPNSQTILWDDADSIILRRYMTKKQIKMNWPDAECDDLQFGQLSNLASYDSDKSRLRQDFLHITEVRTQENYYYEVTERFTKVKRPFYRIIDPQNINAEELLSEQEFRQRLQDVCYTLLDEQGQIQVIKAPYEVPPIESLYNELSGGIPMITVAFHYIQPPHVDPNQPPPEPQMMPGEPNSPYAIPGSTRWLTQTTIQELLNTSLLNQVNFLLTRIRVCCSVGDRDLYNAYDLPTSHYPIIPAQNSHIRNPFTTSDVRRMKDLQVLFNKVVSLIVAHTANSTNMKVFVPENSMDSTEAWMEEWGRAGTAFLPYMPAPELGTTGGIEVVHPAPLNNQLFTWLGQIINLMEQVVGIYSLQQGDPARAPDTYRGTIAIDEFSTRRIKSKMDDIYRALGRAGEVALNLAGDVYQKEKVVRLVQSNGDSQVIRFIDFMGAINEYDNPLVQMYDVIVVGGSTLPSNRWAYLQAYMEMFNAGVVDDMAVLRAGEIPDAEEILERKGDMQEMQMMAQQLQQQVEEMSQQMQQMTGQMTQAQQETMKAKMQAQSQLIVGQLKTMAQYHQKRLTLEQQHQKELLVKDRQLKAMQSQKSAKKT